MANFVRGDHYRISPTAIFCAKVRAEYMNMPYTKEIYQELTERGEGGWQGMVTPLIKELALNSANLRAKASILEGRYLSTNDAINRLGPCNVLELACGVSPRGLQFTVPGSPRDQALYAETDLFKMLETKKEIVASIRKQEGEEVSPNHYFMQMNALHRWQMKPVGELLSEKGHDNPVAIVHEGLLMYLNSCERARLRDNIASFLREYSPNGAWITTDMAPRSAFRKNILLQIISDKIAKKTGRKFSGFKSDEEALDFVSEGGLKGEFLPNDHLLDRLSCSKTLAIDSARLKKVAPGYRACFITLN